MDPVGLGICLLVVALAAAIQGSIGFGLTFLSAPVLGLLYPQLVPAPLVLLSIPLVALVLWANRRSVDRGGLLWAVAGCAAGAALAAYVLAGLSQQGYQLAFGCGLLLAVALSLVGWRPRVTPRNALLAGAASGFMATLTAIGGPPIALLYQGMGGSALRGTLSAFFFLQIPFVAGALWMAGRLGVAELELSLWLLPGVLLGYAGSRVVVQRLDERFVGRLVLVVSALGGLILIAKGVPLFGDLDILSRD